MKSISTVIDKFFVQFGLRVQEMENPGKPWSNLALLDPLENTVWSGKELTDDHKAFGTFTNLLISNKYKRIITVAGELPYHRTVVHSRTDL